MVNENRLIESFMELVKIDSISREEKEVADFLYGYSCPGEKH